MAFRFEQKESGSDGVKRVARERVNRVLRNLSRKPSPNAKDIHDARKDLKSLRALLRLVRSAMTPEEWREDNLIFRDSGRTLSRSRDAQVMMETLDELLASDRNSRPPESAWNPASAARIRRELEQDVRTKIAVPTLQESLRSLRAIRQRLSLWLTAAPDADKPCWNALFREGLRESYRKGRNYLRQCQFIGPGNFAEENWHQLRKHAKTLGYQLRLMRPIWPGPLKRLIDELDDLTDLLGKNHDLAVLRTRINQEPYSERATQQAAEDRLTLLHAIDQRQGKLKAAALDIACRVYVEKPRQFERRLRAYWEIWHNLPKEKITGNGNAAVSQPASHANP